jgi:hypothetical protein
MSRFIIFILALNGCGLYATPKKGGWVVQSVETSTIECLVEGYDTTLPYEVGAVHQVEKNPEVQVFNLVIPQANWPGAPLAMPCSSVDGILDCDFEFVQWPNTYEGVRNDNCIDELQQLPPPSTCWGAEWNAKGEYTRSPEPTLTTNISFVLICMAGADCSFASGEEVCVMNIQTVYTPEPE